MSRKTDDKPTIYEIKVSLKGIAPPIWRRLQVADDTTLDELHGILQIAMGWDDAHLHLFIVKGKEYGATDPEFGSTINDEDKAVLGRLVKQGDRFIYVYDFGDDWEHEILVERVLPAETEENLPRCIAGRRACPPEDCGGRAGYAFLLEAIANPHAPESEDRLEWLGDGDFKPEAFDPATVSAALFAS